MNNYPNKIPIFRKSSRSLHNFDSILNPFHFLKEKYDLKLIPLENSSVSSLFLTTRLSDKKEILIKQVIISENNIFQDLKKSLEIFNSIDHPNVDRYHDVFFTEIDMKNEITFLCEKDALNLFEMISSLEVSQPRSEEELLQIFSDIAFALYYCHSKNISHNNIDPYNIVLIFGEDRPQKAQNYHVILKKNLYKLRDWKYEQAINIENLIRNAKNKKIFRKTNLLKPFSAPEGYNNKIFSDNENKAMDVYSLGMCMLSFCGISLKRIQSISLSLQEIHDYQLDKLFQEYVIKSYNWHIVEILKGMLKFNVNERWNIDQVWISLKSLKNLCEIMNGAKSLESDEKSVDMTKSGLLNRFFKKFGTNSNEKREKENSQNSDNDSASNKFSFKLNTKNILINVVSKEDYKSLLNVKPTKNYKKIAYEIEDIMGCWKQIKANSLENFNLEIRTEKELNKEFLDFCLLIVKEKAKMNILTKFTFMSTFEQVSGDFPKFIDSNYFIYILNQNKSYPENNLNITHYYTKNK